VAHDAAGSARALARSGGVGPARRTAVIDIHSHLLPGVDDGAPSAEVSVAVLERFAADGVTRVVCTPHVNATESADVEHAAYAETFERLVAAAPSVPALERGWEIMLDAPGCDLSAPELRLGASHAILVEFPRTRLPARAGRELHRLRGEGLVPVVAHPERYMGCTADSVREWRSVGAAIQTDATMLLGSGPMTQLARQLLGEGLIDCLASDNHGDARTLASARRWLLEIGAEEQAHLLTATNAGRLLADEPPLSVPPVVLGRGVWARLRELVLGRG
jgi:protein-tyrosine phosphatase